MLSFICFLLGTAQYVIAGMLDKISVSIGVSIASAGQLITAFSLANAVVTPFVILAIARFDRRRQLLIGLCIIIVGLAATLFLPGFGSLIIARIIHGVGNGVFVAIAFSLVAELVTPDRVVGAMANIAMGFSAAFVLGVPIGRVISEFYDWRAVFWMISFFAILSVIGIAGLIPPIKGSVPATLKEQVVKVKDKKIAITLFVTFFQSAGYSVVNTYITPLLLNVMPVYKDYISAILLMLGIAGLIGSKLSSLFEKRFGVAHTLIGSISAQALVMLAFYFCAGLNGFSILLLAFWSAAAWIFFPPQLFRLRTLAPEAASILISLNNSFTQFGSAAGAVLGGGVINGLPIISITYIGAFGIALAAVLCAWSFKNQ